MESNENLTEWLSRLDDGDDGALDHIVHVLYGELHGLARRRLRNERDGHTLNATALVNEVYLKLSRQNRIQVASRTQFLSVAATTMRRVLVDYARTRNRKKRGGGEQPIPIEDVEPFLSDEEAEEVLALEAALLRLADLNPRAATVLEQRFFGGLTLEETAGLLGVSSKTVQREWTTARAWLRKEVARELDG